MPAAFYHTSVEDAPPVELYESEEHDLDDYSDPGSEYATSVVQRYSSDSEMPSAKLPSKSAGTTHKAATSTGSADRNAPQTVDNLPALQARHNLDESNRLDPVYEDDPTSYDLVNPAIETENKEVYSLEKRSQSLFSKEHLQVIFSDPDYLLQFTSFLGVHRPQAVPLLVHYVDALKSLRALHYANAILEGLDPLDEFEFTKTPIAPTRNESLEARASAAFDELVKEELPAFIAHKYIQIVSASISARISGSLTPRLREASEGLAEVFCLTDPSRPDNPIVFASEEFNRTTQYGMSYILGRNCRFLQGPWTSPHSVKRLKDAIIAGRQHQELFLNYRRDGSPFMNLLMIAPLCDSRGVVRYFIGAQIDVSGLVKECTDLASYQRLLELQELGQPVADPQQPSAEKDDPLRELSEMMNLGEMSIVKRYGGKMHRETQEDDDASSVSGQPRLLLKDPDTSTPPIRDISGKLGGVYQHYLLVRPYPSLRILFASPSQRLPGVLQSPFMNKIGGSDRVRQELTAALAEGRGVTAKVRWVSRLDEEGGGRNKWIHCTPLIGMNGNIGVWMVVMVDDEKNNRTYAGSRRQAPPIASPETTRPPGSSGSAKPIPNGYGGANGDGSIISFRVD